MCVQLVALLLSAVALVAAAVLHELLSGDRRAAEGAQGGSKKQGQGKGNTHQGSCTGQCKGRG